MSLNCCCINEVTTIDINPTVPNRCLALLQQEHRQHAETAITGVFWWLLASWHIKVALAM